MSEKSTRIEFLPAIKFPAYSCESARRYLVYVDVADDSLMVWDSVAQHFTTLHVTPDWHRARILKEAHRRIG